MATEKKRVMISLTEEQFENLTAMAKETGLTKSGCVTLALMDWSKKMRRRQAASTIKKEFK